MGPPIWAVGGVWDRFGGGRRGRRRKSGILQNQLQYAHRRNRKGETSRMAPLVFGFGPLVRRNGAGKVQLRLALSKGAGGLGEAGTTFNRLVRGGNDSGGTRLARRWRGTGSRDRFGGAGGAGNGNLDSATNPCNMHHFGILSSRRVERYELCRYSFQIERDMGGNS